MVPGKKKIEENFELDALFHFFNGLEMEVMSEIKVVFLKGETSFGPRV